MSNPANQIVALCRFFLPWETALWPICGWPRVPCTTSGVYLTKIKDVLLEPLPLNLDMTPGGDLAFLTEPVK